MPGQFERRTPLDHGEIPLLLDLSCGWCGREVLSLEGALVRTKDQIAIRIRDQGLHVARGVPVCLHCGGPLFAIRWKTVAAEDESAA
jgi:hypothetical protein